MVNYLDHFPVVSDSLVSSLDERGLVLDTLRFLDFHVAYDKLVYPAKAVTYPGIILGTDRMKLRLPEGKLKLKGLLLNHLTHQRISKKDLESIGGLSSHCSHLVKGVRWFFCKSTYDLYQDLVSNFRRYVNLSENVVADFNWWLGLFPFFRGQANLYVDGGLYGPSDIRQGWLGIRLRM